MTTKFELDLHDYKGDNTGTVYFNLKDKKTCVFEHRDKKESLVIPGLYQKLEGYTKKVSIEKFYGIFEVVAKNAVQFVLMFEDESQGEIQKGKPYSVTINGAKAKSFFLPFMTASSTLKSCTGQDLAAFGLKKKGGGLGASHVSLVALQLAKQQGFHHDCRFCSRNGFIVVRPLVPPVAPPAEPVPAGGPPAAPVAPAQPLAAPVAPAQPAEPVNLDDIFGTLDDDEEWSNY